MTGVLAEDKVTARKQHQCDDCLSAIQPGETYSRQKNLGDGRVWTWKRCVPCDEIAQVVWDYWEKSYAWADGMGPDDFEQWAEEQKDSDPRAAAYLRRRFES